MARSGSGCDQFLNKFDRATETFKRYPVPFVTHITQDSAGTLWLATVKGLYSLRSGNRNYPAVFSQSE